jgi:hypothetical protein
MDGDFVRPVILSYRIPDLMGGIPAIMVAIGVVLLPVTVIAGGPVLFVLFWLGGVGWIAFNFIVRSAHAVAVTNGKLFWTSYLTTVEVPLTDVVRMTLAFGGSVQVIECRDGRKLWVPVMQGYQQFIDAVAINYPDLQIEGSRYSRFVDRVQILRPPRDPERPDSNGETDR